MTVGITLLLKIVNLHRLTVNGCYHYHAGCHVNCTYIVTSLVTDASIVVLCALLQLLLVGLTQLILTRLSLSQCFNHGCTSCTVLPTCVPVGLLHLPPRGLIWSISSAVDLPYWRHYPCCLLCELQLWAVAYSFCSFFLLLETIIPFTVDTNRTPTMNFFVSCRAVRSISSSIDLPLSRRSDSPLPRHHRDSTSIT